MTALQLDVFGGETAHVNVPVRPAPFTSAQREILRLLRNFGSITSSQAGRIVHAHRDGGCDQCRDVQFTCKWAASDGSDAMKRLAKRGVVRRHHRGPWVTS